MVEDRTMRPGIADPAAPGITRRRDGGRRLATLLAGLAAGVTLGLLAGCATPDSGGDTPTVAAHPQPAQAVVTAPPSPPVPEAAPAPVPATPPAAETPPPAAAPAPATGPVRVALLLPLSGRNAALGTALQNAAQMALFDMGASRLELIVRDTDAEGGAVAAARDAVAAGAGMLIGPLFAADTQAVKPVAAGLPILSFSNDGAIAAPGAWVLGFQPRDHVRRVVDYAVGHGLGRVALLAPVGGLGDIVETAARESVRADGGDLVQVGRYQPNQRDISQIIRRIAATPAVAAPNPAAPDAPAAAPALPFQALLIADGGQHLREVAPMLPFFDIDPARIRFLGTGQWDDAGLGREPSLVGGWYAAPNPEGRQGFEKRYADLYGQPAQRLATLAYDAVSLVAALARDGRDIPTGLTDAKGYTGLDGAFRLLPDGHVERALAVLEVTRTGVTVVDPAPAAFNGGGS